MDYPTKLAIPLHIEIFEQFSDQAPVKESDQINFDASKAALVKLKILLSGDGEKFIYNSFEALADLYGQKIADLIYSCIPSTFQILSKKPLSVGGSLFSDVDNFELRIVQSLHVYWMLNYHYSTSVNEQAVKQIKLKTWCFWSLLDHVACSCFTDEQVFKTFQQQLAQAMIKHEKFFGANLPPTKYPPLTKSKFYDIIELALQYVEEYHELIDLVKFTPSVRILCILIETKCTFNSADAKSEFYSDLNLYLKFGTQPNRPRSASRRICGKPPKK